MVIMRKAKYLAIYCTDVGGVNQRIARKRFKPNIKEISFKDETFIVDISKPISRTSKGTYEYHFLRGKGQVIISTQQAPVSPEYVFALLKREYVSQLVAGMNIKALGTELYIWAIMGALAGIGVGVALGMNI